MASCCWYKNQSAGVVALYIDGSLYNTATAGTGAFTSSRDILLGLNIGNSRPYDDGIG